MRTTNNLSPEEGQTILKAVKTLIDIIVVRTGGKPMFGGRR